ncbi:hypothetical protein [Natronorarus salvus]|uniref:hypothetical protein n=1 Tax=Natronorarus salvus TaxID=3117733 RepID=UPI002F26B11D
MTPRSIPPLAYAAGTFVLVSATVHLGLGLSGLYEWLVLGTEGALRPLAMLVAAVLAYGLVTTYVTGALAPMTVHLVGAVLMALYLTAYADVHAFGVVEATTGFDLGGHGPDHGHTGHDDGHGHDHNGHGHDHNGHGDDHDHDRNGHDHGHDGPTTEVLIEHLRADAFALVSKLAEVGALVSFAALALVDRR